MSVRKKIEDAYQIFILCDKNFSKATDLMKIGGPTLRKYVRILECLDFSLLEYLDKRGKEKLTIGGAIQLCDNVINPEYQYHIFQNYINSPKAGRINILKEECICMICADTKKYFEFTPCCKTPICEECLVKTFQSCIIDIHFKSVDCPFCKQSFSLDYCAWFLINRVIGGKSKYDRYSPLSGRVNRSFESESSGNLWRNTKDYDINRHTGNNYTRNLHNKYMKTIDIMERTKNIYLSREKTDFTLLLGDENYYAPCSECTPTFTEYDPPVQRNRWKYLQVCDIPKQCGNGEGDILVLRPDMFRCVVCKSRDENIDNGEFKKCPHCGIRTVKPDGCNYIYCGDHRWCWICNERIENNSNGHNKHYWTGPGTSPYSNQCRESTNSNSERFIIRGKCDCSECKDFGGAPLCKTLDCMNRTFVKYRADNNDMFNDYCIDCRNR